MQMINIKNGITIYKPVGLVFDFMSTPENNFQWQYGTLESYQPCRWHLLTMAAAFEALVT